MSYFLKRMQPGGGVRVLALDICVNQNLTAMNDKDENRFNMIDSVLLYMSNNSANYAGNAAIVSLLITLTLFRDNIQAFATVKAGTSKGATTDKKLAKRLIAYRASEICGPAVAYAVSINDNTLKARVDFSFSDIYSLRDENVPPRVLGIIQALTVLAAVPASGILVADVTELTNLLAAYEVASDQPWAIIVQKKTAGLSLRTEMSGALGLLKDQLDNQMLRYRTSDPGFYNGYLAARVIVDN